MLIHVCMDLALCTGAQACWNRKGPNSPNCPHKVGSMKLSKITLNMTLTEEQNKRPQPQTNNCLGGGGLPCAEKLSVEVILKSTTSWRRLVGGDNMEEVSVQLTLPLRILENAWQYNSATHPGIPIQPKAVSDIIKNKSSTT